MAHSFARLLTWAIATAAFSTLTGPLARAEDSDFFENRIRPLLVEKCYSCHSAEAKKLKGKLWLDSRDGVLKGGENGPVVVAGDPEHSRLIEAVRWTNDDLKMPPKERLSPEQVNDLVKWVKIGLPDPRVASTAKPASAQPSGDTTATSATPTTQPTRTQNATGNSANDPDAARRKWAFSPPVLPAMPDVKQADWCKSPIDRFILAKLEAAGLKPAPAADRRALIRRAYFDLIGLPPTPAEVDAFVNDAAPDAFAKVVDHLLASPHYGECWARHWLDVVRYTDSFDSRGVGSPGDIADAWRYRDWVVNAFNADLPYDQFIRMQVAGDLLKKGDGSTNNDGVIATQVYVMGPWPGGDADRKKMLTDIVDDQVDLTGRAFLGMTLACGRCHDHKFDPFPTADYYGLAGIFFSSHFMPNPGDPTSGGPLLHFSLATPEQLAQKKKFDEQVAALKQQVDSFKDDAIALADRQSIHDADRYLLAAWDLKRQSAKKDAPKTPAYAAEHKLDARLLTRWSEYVSPYLPRATTRTLLSVAKPKINGLEGVDAWTAPAGNPSMVGNATDHAVAIGTLTLPPHTISVHPGEHSAVAVAWRSPFDGAVAIHGRVIDADDHCGDGITWSIDRVDDTVIRIASGEFPNGGRQDFSEGAGADALKSIPVKTGENLEIVVYPKKEYSCDTTVVDLTIDEVGGQRHWNLAHDLLPDVIVPGNGNAHRDSYGNDGTWQFFEVPDQTNSKATDALLLAWSQAIDGDEKQATLAATQVRDALLALDASADQLKKEGKDIAGLEGAGAALYRDIVTPKGQFAAGADENSLSAESAQKLKGIKDELASLQAHAPPPLPECEGMTEGGVPQGIYAGIADAHIHIRGRYDRQSELVPRHFPRFLGGDRQPAITQGSGRLQLADFLADPKNPLTARVMINRVWQHHFGEGIVRTPNNYGKLGRPPTHPELLDWLALRFIDKAWSIKAMQREMMLSAAYQQSSIPDPQTLKVDPDNLLFGWIKRRRLEAEGIRDSLLAQSGQLDPALGGPAIRDLMTHRRTLYLMTIRSERSDYRTLFDAADSSAIVDQRIDSTVAPQALFLLNNPFVLQQAGAIAGRVLHEGGVDDRQKISWLYQHLYGRPVTDKEVEIGLELLKESIAGANGEKPLSTEAAWNAYCQVLVCANEFVYVD